MALDFDALIREVDSMPTVHAGALLALARVRNELEAFVATEDLDGVAETLRALDANSARLVDAIVDQTPAQAPHEARAAQVQSKAPNDIV